MILKGVFVFYIREGYVENEDHGQFDWYLKILLFLTHLRSRYPFLAIYKWFWGGWGGGGLCFWVLGFYPPNNKLINNAGSLCSSDSVEEENEIEKQSGRPVQGQIAQSQRGKAKTVLVENNWSTASLPFRFFIQLSSQTAYMSCDVPLLYGSYINIRSFCNI